MKIIDGITLLKMIKDGTITNKTKLNCVDWFTSDSNNKVYVDSKGIVKWEVSNIALTQEMLIKYHFEILEDKEYTDIKEIKSTINGRIMCKYDGEQHYLDTNIKDKAVYVPLLNALIRNQKYILERLDK